MGKLVCIDNLYDRVEILDFLTLYKIYDCESDFFNDDPLCKVHDDSGKKNFYYKDRFILLADWREEQIKSIIDE